MKKILVIVLSAVIMSVLLLPVSSYNLVFAGDAPEPKKVEIEKQPEDENTRDVLLAQGIDPEYVMITKDYGLKSAGKSPYNREYKDIISGKYVVEMQQLPMVNANGSFLDTSWSTTDNKNFTAGINQFIASVATSKTTIIVFNDQPDGKVKKDMALSFQPQFYLDEKETKPAINTPALLPVDPLNENYTNNTLEWNFGIAKRRLRLIEGSLLGSWVFDSKPVGTIRIKYNQTGEFKLKLGQFAINNDEEQISPEQFDELVELDGYPVTISDTATFYPDAGVASVDGYVRQTYAATFGETWATIIGAAGNSAGDGDALSAPFLIESDSVNGRWIQNRRSIFLFDTEPLPNTCTVTNAVFSLRGRGKLDGLGITPDVNVYASAPASDTALAAGDYDSVVNPAFCDTPITYAGWDSANWNDFTLNAAGIAAISLTDVSKFGTMNANYDAAGVPPAWSNTLSSYLQSYYTEQGVGFRPKLVVTYTTAATVDVETNAADVASTTATLNGDITNTGTGIDCISIGFGWGTTSQANPGNTAPAASAYDDSWEEAGAFGIGAFDYDAEGLTELTLYYFRAAVENSDSFWTWGEEQEFFVGEEGKIYRGIRPDLDETLIRSQAGIPTDVIIGNVFWGYSLPIWNSDNEQLQFQVDAPDWWDGESDILIHIHTATPDNETGNTYGLQLTYNYSTPNIVEAFPAAGDVNVTRNRTVGSGLTYAHYMDVFVLAYDHDPADPMIADDVMGFRLRRIANEIQGKELDNELIIVNVEVYFAELPGEDCQTVIDENIADGTLIGGMSMFLIVGFFGLMAVGLTAAMHLSRHRMLAFPAAILWFVVGGFSYALHTVAWDAWFIASFAFFFLGAYATLAQFGLRESGNEIDDKEGQAGEEDKAMDEDSESKSVLGNEHEEPRMSKRTRAVRKRAENRRTEGVKPKSKTGWGEFS